ncbi:MAG: hypothetical protein IJ187_00450 [Neisseriaceae bacterium]|nr:hypothetical protein [Neisseriaceae bacterium]MBQ9723936.1 hypothetical protein [Neisseriaceae bacterium]
MTTQTKELSEFSKKLKEREEFTKFFSENAYLRTVESVFISEVEGGGNIYLDIELWRNRRTGKEFYRNEYRDETKYWVAEDPAHAELYRPERTDKQAKNDALSVLNKYIEQANNAVWQLYGIFGAVKNQLTPQDAEKLDLEIKKLTQAMTAINGDKEETALTKDEQDNNLPF